MHIDIALDLELYLERHHLLVECKIGLSHLWRRLKVSDRVGEWNRLRDEAGVVETQTSDLLASLDKYVGRLEQRDGAGFGRRKREEHLHHL